MKPVTKTSRDVDTGPGSARDFYHSTGEASECGYSIELSSEAGVDTNDISLSNPSGSSSGAHVSFKAKSLPQTPDYPQLFAQTNAGDPGKATAVASSAPPADLGIEVSDPPGFSRMMLGYKGGALVWRLKHGAIANAAGVHWGDVLLTFAGQPITSGASFPGMVASVHAGDKVEITLYRARTKLTLQAQF